MYLVILVEPDEIKKLSRRFRRLDLNKDGALSMDEFMTIPELQQNPLVKRVIDILDKDGNGQIDFQGESTQSTQNYIHQAIHELTWVTL